MDLYFFPLVQQKQKEISKQGVLRLPGYKKEEPQLSSRSEDLVAFIYLEFAEHGMIHMLLTSKQGRWCFSIGNWAAFVSSCLLHLLYSFSKTWCKNSEIRRAALM